MSIDWKPEAIEAADRAYHMNQDNEDSAEFWSIVLDAAVKSQGDVYTREDMGAAVRVAKDVARAEALKEVCAYLHSIYHYKTAELVREFALKETEQ